MRKTSSLIQLFNHVASWLGRGLIILSFALIGKHSIAQAGETTSEEPASEEGSTLGVQDNGQEEQVTYMEIGIFGEKDPPVMDSRP